MRTLRTAVVVVVLAVVGLALAAPASAHARFLASDPESGETLAELPATVVFTYSEEIAPQFVDAAVIPPGGAEPVTTDAVADGTVVTIDVAAAGDGAPPAGRWQVLARVVSADGHPVEHTVGFDVEPAAAAPGDTVPVDGPTTDAVAEATPEPASTAGAEPSPGTSAVSSDPVAAVTDGLPSWAGIVLAVALIGAGATAVVLQLRRRQPPQD